ncbi:MAG: T9SS type A sorting domain-containing protein, partial [Bacteroidota bacterium]
SPNPATHDMVIGFSLEAPSTVSIELLDALGRVISMPINSFYLTGNHEYRLDVSGLTHGVYHLRMNGYSQTIKFVKVD